MPITQTSVSKNTGKVGIRYFTQARYSYQNIESHFLRSGSTSNAFSGALSLTEISKAAGWTNVKTFGKFFDKPVIDNSLGTFYWTSKFMFIFVYCVLRIGVWMIHVVLYIYQFGLWNLIWILIRRVRTDQLRKNSKK